MHGTNFIFGILISAAGLLLLVIPDQIVKVIVLVLGAEAVINGIYSLVTMRTFMIDPAYKLAILIRGIESIVIGLLAIFIPLIFVETMWMAMLYVLGIYLITAAVIELYAVAKLRGAEINRSQYVLEALISIGVAVVLFLLPRQIGNVILRVLGFIILLIGAMYVYVSLRSQKVAKAIDEVVVESVVVEDDNSIDN